MAVELALILALATTTTLPGGPPDVIKVEDPRPAERWRVDRFACAGEPDTETDVLVEYATTAVSPVDDSSRVIRVRMGDRMLTQDEIAKVNAFVGPASIQDSSAACTADSIRLAITVFAPDEIERGTCLADALFFYSIVLDRRTGELRFP